MMRDFNEGIEWYHAKRDFQDLHGEHNISRDHLVKRSAYVCAMCMCDDNGDWNDCSASCHYRRQSLTGELIISSHFITAMGVHMCLDVRTWIIIYPM